MDKDDVIRKIKACLDMARSGEANEAANAMRQAQALMLKYGIDHPDILAASVSEIPVKASANERPALYESQLAVLIGRASGCQVVFSTGGWNPGQWLYIGCSPSVEVASYSMDVLMRQLRKSRREYMDTELRRFKKKNKTIRADAYCNAWVQKVSRLLTNYEQTEEQEQAVAAYMLKKHPNLGDLRSTDRRSKKIDTSRDQMRGYQDGDSAVLRGGVGVRNAPLQLEM
ncbi:DUF2786 domain-containing protein [Castellaniella hirudinis]|uniref:DUF2786 domain-containing protein n=1 Tax=Castellaniella hirudinis TaxID=1144617 RepID=UPI0039C39BE4